MDIIRIIVIDDHPVVRQGLASILDYEDEIEVLDQGADGLEAIELVKKHDPDLVLIDIKMPKMKGVEAINRIREFNKNVKFIILTTYDDEESVFDGINAGARGYLLKDTTPDELVDAIRKVNRGESLVDSKMQTRLFDRYSQLVKKQTVEHTLTNRELEVLHLIANGASNKDIAAELYISVKTVKTHITHIFEKLEVRDRTESVTKALKLGIIKI